MELRELLRQLGKFSKTDLRQIKAQVEFLLSIEDGKPATQRAYGIEEFLCMYAEPYVAVPPKFILDKPSSKLITSKLEAAGIAIDSLCKKLELDKKEIVRLCKILLECGSLYIKESHSWSKPLSSNFSTLLYVLSKPEDLIDKNYPGYLSAGLFTKLVLKSD